MSPKAKTKTTEPEDVGADEAPSSGQDEAEPTPPEELEISLEHITYPCARCGIGERKWKVLSAKKVGTNHIRVEMKCLGCGKELPYQDDKDEITRRAS